MQSSENSGESEFTEAFCWCLLRNQTQWRRCNMLLLIVVNGVNKIMFISFKTHFLIEDSIKTATWAKEENRNDKRRKSNWTIKIIFFLNNKARREKSFFHLPAPNNSLSPQHLAARNPCCSGKVNPDILFHMQDVKLTVWSWCRGSGNNQSNGDGWTVD